MYSGKNNNKAAFKITRKDELAYKEINHSYWLQIYMIAVVICNFVMLFWDGSVSDTGFWVDWVKQLANKGYEDFNGNYPPIYIHWLYVVSKIYTNLQLPIENNIFLKYLTQIPVVISHLLLTGVVYSLLIKRNPIPVQFHTALLLTALNPAIIFNGSIWGQIDIVPVIPVVFALLTATSHRYKIYTFPLYLVGLLTKFQMIAFAPVFGILFLNDYKTHLKSIPLCVATFVIIFLPYILSSNFTTAFKLAYMDVLHQYDVTTMGAANIWILLTGNAAPDSIVLFGVDNNPILIKILTAKNFGMISFSCVCLYVFIQGSRNLLAKKHVQDNEKLLQDMLFYAILCSMAFFTLLPAMHERYLLPAVAFSLVCFAVNTSRILYPLAFSFISAFNLAMCLGIKTSNGVWPLISWFMLAIFCYGLMELIFNRTWIIFIKDITSAIFSFKGTFALFFVIANTLLANCLLESARIHKINLTDNQIALNRMQPYLVQQDYGNLNTDKSINGKTLTLGGRRFSDGLGTHANSQIDYIIPERSQELSFIVGLDDEIESGSVEFSVWGDDKLLWKSKPYYGAEKDIKPVRLPIENITKLSLRVSGMGDTTNDHADWVQPIITLQKY